MYTLRAQLERGGFSIKRAANPSEALDRLRSFGTAAIEITGPRGEALSLEDLELLAQRHAALLKRLEDPISLETERPTAD